MKICIFGASSAELDISYYDAAEELGRELAQRGHDLVFGGGKHGLMGACARGVSAGGGGLFGIAPKFFDEPGVLYEACTEFIFTDTMRERKQLMEDKSDAVVVLPGGIGTYEEFFEMLTLRQLGQSDRAIAILNTNGYYEPMAMLLRNTVKQKFMSPHCLTLFETVDTPAEALDYIEAYVPAPSCGGGLRDYTR